MQMKAVLTLGVCVLLGLVAVSHAAVAVEKVSQGQHLAEHMHADICSAALPVRAGRASASRKLCSARDVPAACLRQTYVPAGVVLTRRAARWECRTPPSLTM